MKVVIVKRRDWHSPGTRANMATVKWVSNEGIQAEPPPDSEEWIDAIRSVKETLPVRLVNDEQGGWSVAIAEELPTGSGPYVDRRAELVAALKRAGKRVA
jgi:hypothetical protein